MNDLRRKVLGEMEEPAEIDSHLVSRKVLLQDMAGMRLFELRDSLKERPADATIAFRTAPQPKFNKNFELLADDIISNGQRGYKTYILSETGRSSNGWRTFSTSRDVRRRRSTLCRSRCTRVSSITT